MVPADDPRHARYLLSAAALVLLLVAAEVAAHPGRTASDGCHYCRTNCSRWGVPADKRHCHGGGTSPTTSTTQKPTTCPASTGTWRGIRVAPECRCTPYDRDDYDYPGQCRAADRRAPGRYVLPLRRQPVCEPSGVTHRAHRRHLRGARLRAVSRERRRAPSRGPRGYQFVPAGSPSGAVQGQVALSPMGGNAKTGNKG